MNSIHITVYTSGPSCQACTLTKRHLDRRGLTYAEESIERDEILDAAAQLDLHRAPIVCASVNGEEQYWDGYRPDRIDALAGAA